MLQTKVYVLTFMITFIFPNFVKQVQGDLKNFKVISSYYKLKVMQIVEIHLNFSE